MKKFMFILFLTVSTGLLSAQSPSVGSLSPLQQAAIEKVIRDEMNLSKTPGAAVVVVSHNRTLYEREFGVSNVLTGTPVSDSTLFQIGSVTKIFTALALLSELQRSGIHPGDPIGAVLPGLSPGLSRLTCHQLLSHTSGMIDFWPGPTDCYQDLPTFFKLNGDSLLFAPPEEVFSYSNTGYALAGLVLEKLTGKPYTDAVNDIVIKPLGLNHTTFDFYSVACSSFSSGHILNRSQGVVAPYILNVSCPLVQAAGGLYSTVHDLQRLVTCLMDNGRLDGRPVFDEAIVTAMTGRYAANFTGSSFGFANFPDNHYGYGMFSFQYGPSRLMGNIGIASQMTYLMYEPEKKFGLILLSNLQMDMLVESFRKICDEVLGETLTPTVPAGPDPAESRAVSGTYRLQAKESFGEATAEIFGKDGRLFIRFPGAPETELTRTRAGEYRFTSPESRFPVELVFQTDHSGKVRYMRYYWSAWEKIG